MSQKQLAVITATDGRKYRITKWNDRGAKRMGHPKQPATIKMLTNESGWEFLDNWELERDKYRLPGDQRVLKDALERLEKTQGITPETIVLDDYNGGTTWMDAEVDRL